jgi:Protein of unknown function (DUF2846)
MVKAMCLTVWVFMTLTTSACVTRLTFQELKPNIAPDTPENGRVFFYRPSRFFGWNAQPDVVLNDVKVGVANLRGYFYVDRPPGKYQVVTRTEVDRKLSFILEKGQTRFVRLSAGFGYLVAHIYAELVDADVGLAEIQECRFITD